LPFRNGAVFMNYAHKRMNPLTAEAQATVVVAAETEQRRRRTLAQLATWRMQKLPGHLPSCSRIRLRDSCRTSRAGASSRVARGYDLNKSGGPNQFLRTIPLIIAQRITIHGRSPKISLEPDLPAFGNPKNPKLSLRPKSKKSGREAGPVDPLPAENARPAPARICRLR
jgi:hypothetical protein